MSGGKGGGMTSDKGETRFIPPNWKKTWDQWMDDIQPWCISRQLWWGHQVPAWYGISLEGIENYERDRQLSKEIFVAENEVDAIKLAQSYYGKSVNISIVEDGVTLHCHDEDENLCSIELVRDPDVLDTWFSSGLWPFATLGWPEQTDEFDRFYPTSTLVTAFDIIFFWVARMMMQGLHLTGKVPFKDVYIHALVLDEHGQKNVQIQGQCG